MKSFITIFSGILLAVSALVFFSSQASAAPTSTNAINLFLTGLAGNGTKCLHILNSGLVTVASDDCGTGAGSGFTNGILLQKSGTFTLTTTTTSFTLTLPPASDYLSSSTIYVATNTGNWLGTWQGNNPSAFYLTTNPAGYGSSTAPALNNGTIQFNNSGAFGGIANLTHNTSTKQIRLLQASTDNPGTSISVGGALNLTNGTDTEALVIWDGGIAHNNANPFYVNCTATDSIQGCMTVAGSATSSSPLNVKSSALNKSGLKVDIISTSTVNANAAAIGFDNALNGAGSAQGIRGFQTFDGVGDWLGFYNSSTVMQLRVSASGTVFAAGSINASGSLDITGAATLRASTTLPTYTTCTLKTDGSGLVLCGSDNTGGGSLGVTTSSPIYSGGLAYFNSSNTITSALPMLYDAPSGRLTLGTSTISTLTIGSLNGLLKGTSGLVGTATAGADYVATNTGDWLGTWQSNSPSAFYLATNPAGYSSSTPGTPNGAFQINSGNVFTGVTEMAYATSTQQTVFTAQSNVNYGVSQSVGGVTRWNGTNSTSSLVVGYTNQAAPSGSSLQWTCDTAWTVSACATFRNLATTTALDVRAGVTAQGVLKLNVLSTSTANANASALSFDRAVNATGSAQGIRGFETFDGIGDWLGFYNSSTVSQFRISSNGTIFTPGSINASGSLVVANASTSNQSSTAITANSGGYIMAQKIVDAGGTRYVTSTPSGANPTATVGTSAVNGSATTFMRSDGAPALGTQFASSSLSFNIYDATTTSPYSYAKWRTNVTSTLQAISCDEKAAATTTIEVYKVTAGLGSIVNGGTFISSMQCGVGGNTQNASGTNTIAPGDFVIVNVTSTAGTPTWTVVNITYAKN